MGIDLETISCHGVIQKTGNRALTADFRRALWSGMGVWPAEMETYLLSMREYRHISNGKRKM